MSSTCTEASSAGENKMLQFNASVETVSSLQLQLNSDSMPYGVHY
jgi:hypothetical protein